VFDGLERGGKGTDGTIMKPVSPVDYVSDTLFPRVAGAVDDLLASGMAVSVPRVFVKMGILMPEKLREWQQGRVPYLERVVMGSLGKTNRIVRIVSLYAHDLKLPPAPPHAAGPITHAGRPLRFSKTGVPKLEAAYKRVFSPRPPDWKAIPPPPRPEWTEERRRTTRCS
jgi:hypothetical protein